MPGRGRPPLRIGEHGRISRTYLGGGVWRAECRYRDSDGVTRKVRRIGPPDEHDRRGKLAEDALVEALVERRPPDANAINLDTLVQCGPSTPTGTTPGSWASSSAVCASTRRRQPVSTRRCGRCGRPTGRQWRAAPAPCCAEHYSLPCSTTLSPPTPSETWG